MSKNYRRDLENGFITIIAALTYINDNSVPVEFYEDNSKELAFPLVSVRCNQEKEIAAGVGKYTTDCEITFATSIEDDKNHSVLDNLEAELIEYFGTINDTVNLQALADAAGFQTDGVILTADEPDDQGRGENHYMSSVKFKVFFRKQVTDVDKSI